MEKQEKSEARTKKKSIQPSSFRHQTISFEFGNFKKGITKQNIPAQSVTKPIQIGNKGVVSQ